LFVAGVAVRFVPSPFRDPRVRRALVRFLAAPPGG
jgi:hypothetical protein